MLASLRSHALCVLLALVACGDSEASGGAGGRAGGGAGTAGQGQGAGVTTGGQSAGGGTAGAASGGAAQGGGGAAGTGGTGGMGGSAQGGAGTGGGGGAAPQRTRIVAANLTSGNGQDYDLKHGQRILTGLDPDVVLLQEFNYGDNTNASLLELVDLICGGGCEYARGPDATIPNGIISRLPILEHGSWTDALVSDRDFVWARIDVPGDVDLWAVSVHLLGSGATQRENEATALLAEIDANIPDADMIVLGGDFNTNTRTEAALTVLGALFSVGAPFPSDQDGNENTNSTRNKPYDWLLADPELVPFQVPVVIGANAFDAGLVVDTRVYSPLTDLAPAQLGDSGAPSMQHMAVVKDFVFPGP